MREKKRVRAMPSSLRDKKRYIVFRADKALDEFTVNRQLLSFLGVYGFAKASPKLIEFNGKTGKGILRARLSGLNETVSAILMLKGKANALMYVQVTAVSGTLKKARKYAEST